MNFNPEKQIKVQAPEMPANVFFVYYKDVHTFAPDKSIQDMGNFVVHPKLVLLLLKVATDNPTRIIVGRYRGYESVGVNDFEVYANGERIGDISYSGGRYHIGSEDIAASMTRKGYKSVKDLEAAYKLVKKIAPRSCQQIISKAQSKASNLVHRIRTNAKYEYERMVDKVLYEQIFNFVQDKGEEFRNYMLANGVDAAQVDKVFDAVAKVNQAEAMCEDADTSTCTVCIRDGVYIVSHPNIKTPKGSVAPLNPYGVYDDSDKVPAHIRGSIGMLKLVPEETLIPNVGVRCEENVFFVKLNEV